MSTNPFEAEPLHTLIVWAACAAMTEDDAGATAYTNAAAEVLWRQTQPIHPSTFTRADARAMARGAVAAMVEIISAD